MSSPRPLRRPAVPSVAPVMQFLGSNGKRFLVASGFASAANLAFHPIVSRATSLSDYGAIAAILAIFSILLAPTFALQVVIARAVERQRRLGITDLSTAIGRMIVQCLGVGFLLAILVVAFASPIASYLHIDDTNAVRYIGAYIIPLAVGIVPRAFLLGEQRYRPVGLAVLAGAVVRLLLASVLTESRGITGAVAACVLGEAVTALVLLPLAWRMSQRSTNRPRFSVYWGDADGALVALSGFWFLASLHMIVARHVLPTGESSRYLAIAILAQSSLFVASAVSVIAAPQFSALQDSPIRLRRLLTWTTATVGAVSVVIASLITILRNPLLRLVFGNEFVDGATQYELVAVFLTLSCAALGVAYLLVHYHLAHRSREAAAIPWIGTVTLAALMYVFHSDARTLALIMFIASASVLVAMIFPAMSEQRESSLSDFVNQSEWAEDNAALDVSMVVPYFNPGQAVQRQVQRLSEVLGASGLSYEIIAVSDGSTDGSEAFLRDLDDEHLRLVRLVQNTGKGEALRVGLALGRGFYLGFIDADGDIDPVHLDSYLKIVRMYEPDIVLGSKRHPMSDVSYPPLRVLYSWGYHKLVHLLFRLRIRDTQTGLKLIRRDVLVRVLPRMLEKRFAFDLELMVVARHAGYERFFEAPIRVDHQFTSTVSWRTTIGMLLDTAAIWYRLHLVRHYDEPTRSGTIGVTEHNLHDGSVVNHTV